MTEAESSVHVVIDVRQLPDQRILPNSGCSVSAVLNVRFVLETAMQTGSADCV